MSRYTREMTTALKTAISYLKRLPEEEQEVYANEILRDLEGDKRWDELFEATTDEQWAKMVAEAKADVAENGSMSLEELKASL